MIRKKSQWTRAEKTSAPASKQRARGVGASVDCPTSKRYTPEQKAKALGLLASGTGTTKAALSVGATEESVRLWKRAAIARGAYPPAVVTRVGKGAAEQAVVKPAVRTTRTETVPRSPYTPAPGAQALSGPEVASILEWKRKHPVMGPAQLRAQLKRFQGLRVSLRAIARVLKAHGYVLEHRGKRAKGEQIRRFEAPRPNALWQADFTEVRVHDDKLYVLVMLDDFSRFVVGWALAASPATSVAVETLHAAMARHGKPEALRTDRGGAFVAFTKESDFGRVLEAELIDHIVGRSYSPRGGGKVESAIRTLKRELWELEEFRDRDHAEQRLREFFLEYNESRAHMGIDGVTPADRYGGRADRVLAYVEQATRARHSLLAQRRLPGSPVEEVGVTGAPLEVLRLVALDGVMELRFCGARVVLGRVES